jgi:sRNA-binding carbon storage regulator CsrA
MLSRSSNDDPGIGIRIAAPDDVPVGREEIYQRKQKERATPYKTSITPY